MFSDTLPSPALATAPDVACGHCGLPVPRPDPTADRQFCCSGCASVFELLRSADLEDYYRYRADAGAPPRAANPTGRSYAELDDPDFTQRHCRPVDGGGLATELFLENVHCAACVWLTEKASSVLPGVGETRLDLAHGVLRVHWDPTKIRLSRVAAWLDAAGYPCHPLHGLDQGAVRRREDRRLLMRIGVAGAAAGNAMLFAIALYTGAFSSMDAGYVLLFRWASLIAALPSVLWSAAVFHRGALAALRTVTPHMDLPISIGICVGTASGIVNTVRSRGDVYFDTITMLIFLLLVGRLLERRQRRRADDASDVLRALAPSTARLVESGSIRQVPVETVMKGNVVEIRAGEHVPVDGTVVEGNSSIDLSMLSGESVPEDVGAGDVVHAGTVNLSARLLVRVEKAGQETRLARLVASVAEAAARRAPVVVLANRLAGYFVVTVLAAAAVTAALLFRHNPAAAIERAVALLVVTCPCALGLATPLAFSAALGRAARRGLMVKGGEFLEALARPGLIVFDKTGTLTEGKLGVVEFAGDPSVRGLVFAAESGSGHPIARALCSAFEADRGLPIESMHETLGGGVEATVSGKSVVVGSEAFVRSRAASSGALVDEHIAAFAARAVTPVLVAVDGVVVAVVGVADPVRADARPSLERLRALGYRLAVLSGDQPAVVGAVAERIGVPFEEIVGGASPEEKLAFVEGRARRERVFMVGDGVNDAAALSAATVGIAVHGGAEASLAAASVFSTSSGLRPVVELVEGARRTLRVVRGNLTRSLAYNLAVGTLAATGFVGPLLAALLMPVSSIGVIMGSYRSRTFGDAL